MVTAGRPRLDGRADTGHLPAAGARHRPGPNRVERPRQPVRARGRPVGRDRVERMYRLEPLDTSGVFLGLGIVQCLLLGGGVTLAVLAISAGAPVPFAASPVLVAALLSFARAGGHTMWEWLPLIVGWLWGRMRRGHRWQAPLPLWPSRDEKAPMPPCLDGLDIVGIDWRSSSKLGAVRDRH